MSGLIDAVETALYEPTTTLDRAAAVVLAVADWLEEEGALATAYERSWAATALRAEVAPPPPPTAEDVIRKAYRKWSGKGDVNAHIAIALRDAGLLREDV